MKNKDIEYKVAKSTCNACSLIKPRTEMKRVVNQKRSGSSLGYGLRSKNITTRAYYSSSQVWVCKKCLQIRLRKKIALIFIFIILYYVYSKN